ncbi:hypothetical protein V6N11_041872 [Hibiscus sabdariffa]|uniref:RNase H type-1 domain-containing protein n=2 Tax=Hibiscus sabdariffa TaxID=183260 RepID=A0ABR2BBE3_9ROSI
MVEEFGRANSLLRKAQLQALLHNHIAVHWVPPPEGWIKINSDGSRNTCTSMSTCRGVGRDSNSSWCFSFAKDIGICSCLEAKLWGIYEGLATAWSLRYTRVLLETDNRKAYDTVLNRNLRNVGSSIISSIFEILSRQWEVRFSFIRREGNRVADAMACLVLLGFLDHCRWMDPPLAVQDIVLMDGSHTIPSDIANTSNMGSSPHPDYDVTGDT